MGMYTANLTPHIYAVSIDTVADGDYEFDVGDMYEPLRRYHTVSVSDRVLIF